MFVGDVVPVRVDVILQDCDRAFLEADSSLPIVLFLEGCAGVRAVSDLQVRGVCVCDEILAVECSDASSSE